MSDVTLNPVRLDANDDPFQQDGVGAVLRTMLAKAKERVTVSDFWVAGDTTKIQDAINSLPDGGVLNFVPGSYQSDALVVPQRNIQIRLNGASLQFPSLSWAGDNGRFYGNGGQLIGGLRIAQLTQVMNAGETIAHFDNGHPFVVGDGLQSSYGLGSDGSDPITVVSVTPTTVTFAVAAHAIVPVGAYIGNYNWSGTILASGSNFLAEDFEISMTNGYALVSASEYCRFRDINILNTGLDLTAVTATNSGVPSDTTFERVMFGVPFEPAKQGISIGATSYVTVDGCGFARKNSDSDIYIYGDHNGTKLKIRRSSFDATGGLDPAPYDTNARIGIQIFANEGSIIDEIDVSDGCTFKGYVQGVIANTSGSTVPTTLNRMRFDNSVRMINTSISNLQSTVVMDGVFSAHVDGDGATNNWPWASNAASTIRLIGARFANLQTTQALQLGYGLYVDGCIFTDCRTVRFDNTTRLGRNTFIRTQMANAYSQGEFVISNPAFAGAADIGPVINISNNASVKISLLDGTLDGYAYRRGAPIGYLLNLRTVGGDFSIAGLRADDWYIPINSIVECIQTDKREYVTKSAKGTLGAAAAAGNTTVTVAGVVPAVGDHLNILLDSRSVHCTTISAVNGGVVTLNLAIPSGQTAAVGNPVCDWFFNIS